MAFFTLKLMNVYKNNEKYYNNTNANTILYSLWKHRHANLDV